MISKASLLATLRQNAGILSAEYDDTALNGFLDEALIQHNRRYTFSSAPSREGDAVLFLAWIKVCYARAGKATQYFQISGKSASGDKSQIMRNNLELVRELRAEYTTLCGRLGISAAPEIIVSDFTILDESLSGITPVNSHLPPEASTLTQVTNTADSTTLQWTQAKPASDFVKYRLFYGTTPGLQDLTTMSETDARYPGIDATKATLLAEYTDIWKTDVKVSGLTTNAWYYFVVVSHDVNDRIGISNEVACQIGTAPAPSTELASVWGNTATYQGNTYRRSTTDGLWYMVSYEGTGSQVHEVLSDTGVTLPGA